VLYTIHLASPATPQGRSTAHHALNAHSSRSHVLFTVYVEMRTSEAAAERAVLSKLHLVDLAGSERTKKTAATGGADTAAAAGSCWQRFDKQG
jgi:hypothetical protein